MIQKKILLITTGGTIASKKDVNTSKVQSGVISGNNLSDLLPKSEKTSFEIHDIFGLPSGHLTLSHLKQLKNAVEKAFKQDSFDGIVVTHGTDTLEETAYFLDLVLDEKNPVVITGSQLPPEEEGTDAIRNLQEAMAVALNEDSQDKGVLVVFNNKIFAGSEVIKVHTNNLDGFAAPGFGPLGYIDEGEVLYTRFPINKSRKLPNINKISKDFMTNGVFLIKFGLGMDGTLVKGAVNAGAAGLILEGFGRGQIPVAALEEVENAVRKGIPVILTTRCYEGKVKGVYDYKGSGAQLERIGVILAGDLPGHKARIKLILALSNGYAHDEIKELFS